MPILMPECAGKPYQPSNGTEGMMFMERWCDLCTKDNEAEEIFCDILTQSFKGKVKEWVFDEQGVPKCTAFEALRGEEVK